MGILLSRAPILPKLSLLLLIGVGAVGVLGISGCGSKEGSSKVSSGLFLAPITQAPNASGQGAIDILADRLDFLRAIRPGTLDSDLADTPAEATVLGRLSSSTLDAKGNPTLTNDLLVYEAKSKSIVSVDMCASSSSPTCGAVRLHYNQKGLEEEQGEIGAISTSVPAVKLRNGWILAFDSGTFNLVAFREQDPRQVLDDIDGDGTNETRTVPYRSAARADGSVNTVSKNFGDGNGLLLSVVLSGEEAADQLRPHGVFSPPRISRLIEIEENKILVFYDTGTLNFIELLELQEETGTRDFNLDPPDRPSEMLEVKVLRGKYKLFPGPFLPYDNIAKITGSLTLELNIFQPILIPDAHSSNPNEYPYPGAVLIFDQTSSIFLKVGVSHNNAGDIVRSTVETAVLAQQVFDATAATPGSKLKPRGAYYNSEPKKKQILIFEESTRNILAYDYAAAPGKNLSVFVNPSGFLNRRDPRGTPTIASKPAVVDFAVADVNSNRLGFDQGLEQIIGISYSSGVVVVVADLAEISQVTLDPIVNVSYIQPLDDTNIRAFDSRSTSLLRVRLQYAAFPIAVQN